MSTTFVAAMGLASDILQLECLTLAPGGGGPGAAFLSYWKGAAFLYVKMQPLTV